MIAHADDNLRVALRLHESAHDAERHARLALVRDKPWDERVVRELAWGDLVRAAWLKREVSAAVVHRDAVARNHHARPKARVVALEETDHVALRVGRGEKDGTSVFWLAVACGACLVGIDELAALVEVAVAEEVFDRHTHVLRVGDVLVRVGKRQLHRLDLQVHPGW